LSKHDICAKKNIPATQNRFFCFRFCTAGFGLRRRGGDEKFSDIYGPKQVFLFVYIAVNIRIFNFTCSLSSILIKMGTLFVCVNMNFNLAWRSGTSL
jgi:hypothetical protein